MKNYTLLILLALTTATASAQDESIVKYFDGTQIKESDGMFRYGQPHGRWKYYTRAGNVYKEVDYFVGRINGRTAFYYDNGKLKSEGYIYDGVAEGTYCEFNRDGSPSIQGRYHKSKKDSIWNYFNINGSLILVEKCESGDCIVQNA